ncbi:MAG: ABC transporter permease subunit [Deltaproteobacteria bacterium]|nr:ABC transporter permease subunit [Deltaproteobacteria bacterium]
MIKVLLRRFIRRKSAVIGLALITLILAAGLMAQRLAPHDPYAVNVVAKLKGPSMEYPLGTDQLGRCVFSRLLYGARTCLGTGLLVTLIITLIGVPIGIVAGYAGGAFDNLAMRAVDIATTFPSSMLALALVGIFGPSLHLLILVFIGLWWAPFARLVRSMVIKVKEKEFVLAAESGGSSRLSIIVRHIAPNVLSPVIVYATLRVAAVIAHVAGFSFLGLGSQPPTADWGVMLSDARQFLTSAPMLLIWPGLAIMLSVLSFNMFGEGLSEALTPDPSEMAKVKEDTPLPSRAMASCPEGAKAERPHPEGVGAEAPLAAPPRPPAEPGQPAEAIVSIRGLKVYFKSGRSVVKALDGVNLDVRRGRITAVVGGSGSGKSVLALSMLRLIDPPGWQEAGTVRVAGRDLGSLTEKEMRAFRGRQVAMIFQDPSGSMNPVAKVKKHLFEAARTPYSQRTEALEDFKVALARVGLNDPERVLESYPFELSGGMCQRVMVAMGLAAKADVLIADEPTSNLDLTTQAAILDEFFRLRDSGLTIVLITHDLGVVAQTADDVCVIHEGRTIESGTVERVFLHPAEEFTKTLLASVGASGLAA